MTIYRLLILSGVVLIQFYNLYHNKIKRSKKMQLLHQILELVPLTPSQIKDKLNNSKNISSLQICNGNIFAGESCSSFLDVDHKVVYSKLFDGQLGLYLARQKVLRVKQPSYLKIKDELSSINLFQTHKTVIIPTKMLTIKPKNVLINKIKNTIKGFFKKVQNNSSQYDYSLYGGQNIKQLVLSQGSKCAVLGKFINDNNGLNCNEPKLISPSKQRMIALIQQDLLSQKLLSFILFIATCVTIAFLLKQIWRIAKLVKEKSKDLYQKINKIFLKSRICNYCHKNMSCILSKPCMHMTACQQCWQKRGGNCSECNKKVKQIVEMFVC